MYELNLVVIKKQKTTLVAELQKEEITSFEEATKLIDPKLPLILLINGKGIIHKKVNVNETDTPATLLNKILPNANLDEFIIQQTPVNSNQVFVSVIRLNILTEIVEGLVKNKLTAIFGCFLGPFVVNALLPLMDSNLINNEHLIIANHRLQIREQQITDITGTEFAANNILIGNDTISQKTVIAFAGALTYFTGNQDDISNSALLNALKEEFIQKQKFELRGWVALAATFIILKVNYFVFNNYWSKNNEMNSQLLLTQSALQRYDTLKTEFAQKKEFLEQNGLLENSRTSYYADNLAKDLPGSIQWTSVNIHPLKKKKAGDESEILQFENKMIAVSGNCQRSTELNEWMKQVKKQNWVNDITLVN